jgi:hypothetical protein
MALRQFKRSIIVACFTVGGLLLLLGAVGLETLWGRHYCALFAGLGGVALMVVGSLYGRAAFRRNSSPPSS